MRKLDKPSPTESQQLSALDPEPPPETLTALCGMPLLVQAFRSLGLPASVKRQVRIKQRQRGYQLMLAVWAETGVVLADEFRDGNVPAQMEPLNAAQRAFAAVPSTVETYYFRGDSACHEALAKYVHVQRPHEMN